MDAKSWWKSKTLWANAAVIGLGIADQLVAGGLLPKEWIPAVLAMVGIVNVVLRTVTTAPLTTSAAPK